MINYFYYFDSLVLKNIINYLPSLHDYLCFVRAFPLVKKRIHLNDYYPIKTQIFKDLEKNLPLDIPIEVFLNTLEKNNGFMAGSYILEKIYNTKWDWEIDDIDIFVPTDSDYLEQLLYYYEDDGPASYHSSAFIYEDGDVVGSIFTPKEVDRPFDLRIDLVKNYYSDNGCKFQIIQMTPDLYTCRQQFCKEVFDLDFCKISFDGKRIRIGDIDAIIYKKSNYPRKVKTDTENRILKYKNRGFTILKNTL